MKISSPLKKELKRAFFLALIAYCLFVGGLTLFQRHYLYFPSKEKPDISQAQNMKIITVQTDDNLTLEGWFQNSEKDKPVIILFHGNARDIADRMPKIQDFLQKGYGILLAEYRGFSGNPGKPTEQNLYRDARAYMDWLIQDQNIPSENIVLYGESLGSGVAVQMASEYQAKALVLDVPFTSVPDIARIKYYYVPFLTLLIQDDYNNLEKIKRLKLPVLIGVGGQDTVVPARFGKKLYDSANQPKTLKEYPYSDHSHLYKYGFSQDTIDFIEALPD